MSGSISRSSRLVILLTAFTIVLGLHAVEGGGARRAPAPSDAGDLAAGRDMFVLRRRRFTSDASSAALCGCLEFGLITPRAMQLCVRSFLHDTSGDLWRSASIPAASRAPVWHPLRTKMNWLGEAKTLIRFVHRTALARSEDSSGSAGRRLSIHAVDCTGLVHCCGTCAERRRPALATASNYAFIVLRVANDAAERCKQLAFCSGSIRRCSRIHPPRVADAAQRCKL